MAKSKKCTKSKTRTQNKYRDFVFGKTPQSKKLRNKFKKVYVKRYGMPIGKNVLKLNKYLLKEMATIWSQKKKLARHDDSEESDVSTNESD